MSERADVLAERIFGSLLGTMEVFTIYLGDRLGLYAALAEGPSTPGELAARAGIAERYAREWLEQQAVNGFLEVDNVAAAADARRYTLPPEHAEVLLDRDALTYLTPISRALVAAAQQMPALMTAYRGGGGVNWRDYGPDMSEGQEYGNRPAFMAMMQSWIPQGLPDVHERLSSGGRVADVGCGGGWSSIAIAQAYEGSHRGRVRPRRAGGRARPPERRGARSRRSGPLPRGRSGRDGSRRGLRPRVRVRVHPRHAAARARLRAMRSMASDGGGVMVMDENVGHEFTAPGDELERLMYGYSTLVCLPDGMSHPDSVGTGTVMRPAMFEGYAKEAGFERVEILPIEADLWRFYRLHP